MFLSPWKDCTQLAEPFADGGGEAGRDGDVHHLAAVLVQFQPRLVHGERARRVARDRPGSERLCDLEAGAQGSGNWSANPGLAVGKMTSSVRATKPYGGSPVVWVDGHAKFMNDSALAAGT